MSPQLELSWESGETSLPGMNCPGSVHLQRHISDECAARARVAERVAGAAEVWHSTSATQLAGWVGGFVIGCEQVQPTSLIWTQAAGATCASWGLLWGCAPPSWCPGCTCMVLWTHVLLPLCNLRVHTPAAVLDTLLRAKRCPRAAAGWGPQGAAVGWVCFSSVSDGRFRAGARQQ